MISVGFDTPPQKAIEYLQNKKPLPSNRWEDVWREEHARSFAVAKATKLDILSDIKTALENALQEGQPFEEFKKNLEPVLKAKGWWGQQEGEDEQKVQLGSSRRLRTIYQANMQSAYMAGRYQDMMANIANRPYLQYIAVLDSHTRPSHRALSGRVFAANDRFWIYFYPPNGWGCRCRVRALSYEEVIALGLIVESSDGKISAKDALISQKTGELRPVNTFKTKEAGKDVLFTPDPGWDHNPGITRLHDTSGALDDCYGAMFAQSDTRCIKAKAGQKTYKDYDRPNLKDVPEDMRQGTPMLLPPADNYAEAIALIKSVLLPDGEVAREVATPVENVYIIEDFLRHPIEKQSDNRERYANFILPTLEKPFEVWLTEYEDGFRTRYIGLFKGKKQLLVVVRINQDGSLLWNIMQADDKRLNALRSGVLLWSGN